MKKNIIMISIVFMTISNAESQFNIIVDQADNKYEISEGFSDNTVYGDWNTVSINNCVKKENENNDVSDYYYGTIFSQDQDCQENQERTVTTTRTYKDGSNEIINNSIETQFFIVDQTNNETGTHTENSCLNILNNNFSTGSKTYHIQTMSEPFEVYCDMTTDGGGWMLTQSGVVNSATTDKNLTDYHSQNTMGTKYENMNKPYLLTYSERDSVEFTEFKVLHKGETGMYRNHVVLDSPIKTGVGASTLVTKNILSYQVSNSLNGNDNFYNLSNCQFTSAYTGHIDCLGKDGNATETQNPWYQRHKTRHFSSASESQTNPIFDNTIGIHTCMRFILNDGSVYDAQCSERSISLAMFQEGCGGDTAWKNHLTASTCKYRDNNVNYYQWQEWVR